MSKSLLGRAEAAVNARQLMVNLSPSQASLGSSSEFTPKLLKHLCPEHLWDKFHVSAS